MKNSITAKNETIRDFILVALSIIGAYAILWSFTGFWPWAANPYNSYTLQAVRWLGGNLDLGRTYSHLEIAEFEGRFFISFPPFPSYVMLPFALIFGENTPDGFIALVISIVGAYYTFRLLNHFGKTGMSAIFWTLFLTIGSNMLFVSINAWVWFIAQNMCFALSMMAIYYAVKGKGGLSLAFWACSVGCRPFNAVYLPVLLYILYKGIKENDPSAKICQIMKKNIKWVIAPCIIAASYMVLNYMRFGSVMEFGHNYLPEFTEAPKGQFHIDYIKENIPRLFRFPKMSNNGLLQYPRFDGMAFWLASPIYLSYIIEAVKSAFSSKKQDKIVAILVPVLIVLHFLFLTMHKTMGGFHFGNRYTNDALPFAFLAMLIHMDKDDKLETVHYPLFMLGVVLNAIGTVIVYATT